MLNRQNFSLPRLDAIERGGLIRSNAYHEAIGVDILHFTVDAYLVVSRRVMDCGLESDRVFIAGCNVDVATVDIQDGGHVAFLKVVLDEAPD